MINNMGTLLFDFKEINTNQEYEITTNEKRFIRNFLQKVLIDPDEDDSIIFSETNPIDFSYFILFVMREYDSFIKNNNNCRI